MRLPNLLFILTDDQGAWALGAAGNREIRTPHLDRLAAEGIRFDHFFCASPVCSPARATILTGLLPSRHGVHDFLHWEEGVPANAIPFLEPYPTTISLLREAGYRTGLCGKWHLGETRTPQAGFEVWNAMPAGGSSYYRAPLVRGTAPVELQQGYASDVFTDDALAFLETQEEETPFALHLHFTAPHSPWNRENHPSEIWDRYHRDCAFDSTPANDPAPDFLITEPTTPEARREKLAGYYTAVEEMDRNVGRILEFLEKRGWRENTLIVFMSDNGMNMGHHGVFGKGNATSPPNMFEESVKIPCLISRPGHVPQGRVESGLWSQYDWLPTLLDYLGMSDRIPEGLPGRSFAPLLRGEALEGERPIAVRDEYGPSRMWRSSEWKLVWRYPAGPHELYHLPTDPGERENRFHQRGYQEIVEKLRLEMEAWFERFATGEHDGKCKPVAGKGQRDADTRPAAFAYRFPDAWLPVPANSSQPK